MDLAKYTDLVLGTKIMHLAAVVKDAGVEIADWTKLKAPAKSILLFF